MWRPVLLLISAAAIWCCWKYAASPSHPAPVHPDAAPVPRLSSKQPPLQPAPDRSVRAASPSEEPSVLSDDELQDWLQRAGQNPPLVMRQILNLQDDSRRQELLEWVLAAWLTDGRTEPARWAAQYLGEAVSPAGEELLHELLGGWVQESPLDALSWTRTELPAKWKRKAEKLVAEAWAETEPLTLQQWLEQPAQAEAGNFWTEELVLGLIPVDPALAMVQADTLKTAGSAWELQEGVLQTWLLEDPAGAEAWVTKDGRFIQEFQQLRQSLAEPPPMALPRK